MKFSGVIWHFAIDHVYLKFLQFKSAKQYGIAISQVSEEDRKGHKISLVWIIFTAAAAFKENRCKENFQQNASTFVVSSVFTREHEVLARSKFYFLVGTLTGEFSVL